MVMVMMSMILDFLVAVSWSDIGPFLIAQFCPGPLGPLPLCYAALPLDHQRRSPLEAGAIIKQTVSLTLAILKMIVSLTLDILKLFVSLTLKVILKMLVSLTWLGQH